jgi:hypothetical protein
MNVSIRNQQDSVGLLATYYHVSCEGRRIHVGNIFKLGYLIGFFQIHLKTFQHSGWTRLDSYILEMG